MTNAEALKTYRALSIELSALEVQIRQAERAGHPRGVLVQRYDATRGTNDPTAAAMQLLDGLESLAERKRCALEQLRPQIDALLNQITDFRLLVILQRYYLHGDTDEQIAMRLNLSDRYICRLRNAYIRSQNEPVYIQCTRNA